MNPYAYTQEEFPPYVDSDMSELGNLMVSGALAVLILCLAFNVCSVGFAVFGQALILLGY